MKNKTCCFTGHRIIPKDKYTEIQKCLETKLVQLISQDVIYYCTGGALGFDTFAALAILKLRFEFPHIRFILVLPCKDQTKGWKAEDIKIYNQIRDKADEVIYTSEHYYKGCMHKRNRYLIDNSSYCICYLTQNSGGTKYTVDYAIKKEVKIIMLP